MNTEIRVGDVMMHNTILCHGIDAFVITVVCLLYLSSLQAYNK